MPPSNSSALSLLATALLFSWQASGETISRALADAYRTNPDLNQQRAAVRVTDENVARAAGGYRPRFNATIDAGFQYSDIRAAVPATKGPSSDDPTSDGTTRSVAGVARYTGRPRGVGLTAQQTLFDGNRTFNSVRQAESQVLGARELMRATEQNILLSAAASYMNVLRDSAILSLRRNNVAVLSEQLRQTRDRRDAGYATPTDVAQAAASLAQARSNVYAAQSNLQASISSYRQVVGTEPRRLEPANTVERLLPQTIDRAVAISQRDHPAVSAALHAVDVAELNVKTAEGVLYPTVTLNATINQRADFDGIPHYRALTAAVMGQVTIPLYQGGDEYASVRQAKAQVSQARLAADLQRDEVRAALVIAWGQLQAAKATIASGQAAVAAAEIALYGIREEARAGQRTTFDVLTAQQTLLNARVNLVAAQRDRIVTSYAVLAAIGRLNVAQLALDVDTYDPSVHFDQIKNKMFGVRTPDGQ